MSQPTIWFEIRNLTCHHDIDPADSSHPLDDSRRPAPHLSAGTLRRLWSHLWLPPAVRQMWQARFAGLAAIDALAASA